MTCSVNGCEKPSRSSGLCSGHNHRLVRYGDPLGKPKPKVLGVCAVEGCEKGLAGAGFCRAHYHRFRRHGDPLGGGSEWGAPHNFIETTMSSETDECIQFPFASEAYGYGRIRVNGKTIGAHCYVAELVHGQKPSSKHEACHSCGNGHNGCVNPRHIYWGTRYDNVQDAIRHGTAWAFGRKIVNDNIPLDRDSAA